MTIREANHNDNDGLLLLTRACPMEGSFKLLIDRAPDYFSLLEMKGDYKVFVALENEGIIGSFALVLKTAHIAQASEKVGYLCDMKIAPAFRNAFVAHRLMSVMLQYMHALEIDFFLCVIAKGNNLVEILLKGRAGIPSAFKVAEFNVYQFFPSRRPPANVNGVLEYEQRFSSESRLLLNKYYADYNFSTVIDPIIGIAGDKAWVYRDGEKVVAFISVINMDGFKQNRVMRIPFYIKAAMRIAKLIWPKIKLPREGDALKILNVQYFAFEPPHYREGKLLLQMARHYAYENGFTFLSYGIDARNPFANQFKSVPSVVFHSVGYVFDFSSQKRAISENLIHDNFYLV